MKLRRGSRSGRNDSSRSRTNADGSPTPPDGQEPVRSIEDAPDRQRVRLEGTLRTVTLRPRGGVPALEAELADGTGSIVVVWLGRRRITGIRAGCAIRVQGRIGVHEGARTIFNPRYDLLP